MNREVIPIAVLEAEVSRRRKRQAPKGRRVDAGALEDVQRLLGHESRQRDLVIEHLHKIQDSFGHFAKIPEFKYCAVRVSLGGEAPAQGSYGGGQALRTLLEATAN